jgi:hypothetical protein
MRATWSLGGSLGAASVGGAAMIFAVASACFAGDALDLRRTPRGDGVRGRDASRLIRHPAWSFACQSPYYLIGGRRCDQPVWVYGNPCEVDLGLGRWRPCR